jgi:hypothetical protein
MGVPTRPPAIILGNPFGDIKSIVDNAINKAQSLFSLAPDVIFLLMQGASVPLYTAIKNSLDVNEGIASQVMLVEKALKDRGQPQYIANIAMKVCGAPSMLNLLLIDAGECEARGDKLYHR